MSQHAQLVFAAWFAGLISLAVACFLAWLVWSLCWDLYDHLMQQRTRRRNACFDARVGRDCFRDIPGVHR